MRRSASEILRNLEQRVARLERMNSTKKTARLDLITTLSTTDGVSDIELEDGVITFLMSNKSVEKDIRTIAKQFRVKFEKGEYSDGLGMISTK